MRVSSGPVQVGTHYMSHGPTKTKAGIAKGLRDSADAKKVSLSAWAHQMRYYQSKDTKDANPRSEAESDLLNQLRKWRTQDEEIILMGDFNQNIYTSGLARELAKEDLGVEEQYQKLHGEQAPFFYVRGTEPLMGCFATSGMFLRNYFMAAHGASRSVGSHRLHIIDFCAVSVFGVELPTVTKQTGRRLQYKLKPTRRKYRKDLVNFDSETEHRVTQESFDKQHRELQIACEKKCRTFRLGRVDYTPLLSRADKRQKIYKWVQDFKGRPHWVRDPRNLERACRNNGIECPHKMSMQQAIEGQH